MIKIQNLAYNHPPPLLILPTQHTTATHPAPSPTHYHTPPAMQYLTTHQTTVPLVAGSVLWLQLSQMIFYLEVTSWGQHYQQLHRLWRVVPKPAATCSHYREQKFGYQDISSCPVMVHNSRMKRDYALGLVAGINSGLLLWHLATCHLIASHCIRATSAPIPKTNI